MTLAHSGHWYHSLLYLLPVLLIAAALWWSGRGEGEGRGAAPGEDERAALDPADTPRDAEPPGEPDPPDAAGSSGSG